LRGGDKILFVIKGTTESSLVDEIFGVDEEIGFSGRGLEDSRICSGESSESVMMMWRSES
jgi:hypothetical protein